MSLRLFILCGAGAAAGTFAALSLLAARRGEPLPRVINSSTHVISGAAADDASIGVLRTGAGVAINTGAAFFWGGIAALAIGRLEPIGLGGRAAAAASIAALAGLVDYGLLPRRLTPGWERVLPATDVALALAGMGAGMAAGAVLDGHLERRDATR